MNRGLEIAADAADAAQSLVLDQVSGGVAVRMAVLYHLLAGGQRRASDLAVTAHRCDHRARECHEHRTTLLVEGPTRRTLTPPTCWCATAWSVEAARLAPRDAEVIDADGLVALPGLVDLHTHLREPGREDAETIATGSRPRRPSAATPRCWRWPTPRRSPTPPRRPSGSPSSAARPGLVDVQPVGAVTKGPGRRGARRARADGPLARAGCGSSPTTGTASTTRG